MILLWYREPLPDVGVTVRTPVAPGDADKTDLAEETMNSFFMDARIMSKEAADKLVSLSKSTRKMQLVYHAVKGVVSTMLRQGITCSPAIIIHIYYIFLGG